MMLVTYHVVCRLDYHGREGTETAMIMGYANLEMAELHAKKATEWVAKFQDLETSDYPNPYDPIKGDYGWRWNRDTTYYEVQTLTVNDRFDEEPDDYYRFANYHFRNVR